MIPQTLFPIKISILKYFEKKNLRKQENMYQDLSALLLLFPTNPLQVWKTENFLFLKQWGVK